MHPNEISKDLIGKVFPVLDKGHVVLLDRMGTDASIASDARASLGNEGKTYTAEQDRSLLRRLMRDNHTSPFEMPELKFHVKWPIYVSRQSERHRTASLNERSGRYSELTCEFHQTEPDAWRLQDPDNKQGSAGLLYEQGWIGSGSWFSSDESLFLEAAQQLYQARLRRIIAREQARKDLPVSLYTEMVWKCDLHNLLHFLRLRLAPDAQLEIRQYAQAMASIVERLFPITWEAFVDYRLEAMTLSRMEIEVIANRTAGGFLRNVETKREKTEFLAKMERLGLIAGEGGDA